MFLTRWIFFGVISVFMVACQKEESTKINYVEREKKVVVSPWGQFEYKSISSSDTNLKKVADATVFIKSASSSGSGFFISYQDQVLMVTNHHVLGRSQCTIHGCAGVLVVSGFYPGGPNRKIESLRPIVMSEEYDFSVFQTSLSREEIPTLDVSHQKEDLELKMNVLTLGHPSGATTKSSQLTIQSISNSTFLAKGGIWHGNSGGPVINPTSLKVIGIASAYQRPSALSKDGFFENGYTPLAVRMDIVLHILDHYKDFSKVDQALFLPPQTVQQMTKDKQWFEAIGWRLEDSLKMIDQVFESKNYSSNFDRVEDVLKSYRRIYRAIGSKNLLSPIVADALSKLIHETTFSKISPESKIEDHHKKVRLLLKQIKALRGNVEPLDSCAAEVKRLFLVGPVGSEKSKVDLFYDKISKDVQNYFPVCLNANSLDASGFLEKYQDNMAKLPIDTQNYVIDYIQQYLNYKYLSPQDAKETFSLLQSLASTSDSIDAGFTAEAMIHIINEVPDLLGLGWLNKISERQYQAMVSREQAATIMTP